MPESSPHYRLLHAVTRALTKAIGVDIPGEIFEAMLDEVLELTGSSYGFMGEVLTDPAGTPFLKTHALSNIAWNEETRKLYEKHRTEGLEFRNLDTLFGRVLQTGEPVLANDLEQGAFRCRLPAGHPPLTSFLGLPLRKDGELVGMIGIANRVGGYDQECLDLLQPLLSACATIITSFRGKQRRIRLEEELRHGCLEWENIFQAIGDYALILDCDHTILKANRAVALRTGIPGEQLIGRKCYELFHNTSAPPKDCPLRHGATPDVFQFPAEVRALDGVVLVNCTPIRDARGEIEKIIHIATDITPLKNAEKALIESETRLNTSLEEILLHQHRLNQDQERILRLNRILRMMRDINQLVLREDDAERLVATACDLLLEDSNYLCAWLLLCNETGTPVLSSQSGFCQESKTFIDQVCQGFIPPCLSHALTRPGFFQVPDRATFCAPCPARGLYPDKQIMCGALRHGTTVHGYMLVVLNSLQPTDSDERQLLSELADDLGYALHNLRQHQALALAETRRTEMEARLRQSQKLEAIGTLAGGIAHDFNNILSAILGYAELVQAEVQGRMPVTDDIDQVISSAKRATDLVRQILTLSRQTEQQLQPVRVQYIIKEALKLLRPVIPATIDLRGEIDMHCPPIQADPTEIHQVIMNLATNASHAMADSGGTLTMDLTVVSPDDTAGNNHLLKLAPDRYLRLTVIDTGCGMDPATCAKIFEPYFTTKRKGEGTGLGLAVVYGIVTRLGGEITVRSEPGQGSAFNVYLPVLEELQTAKSGDRLGALPPLPTGKERIMVVDNEEAIAQLLERSLAKLGYRVTPFSLCDDAVREFMTRPDAFDLVITDLDMPKISGIDLAHAFLERRPDIPIILCTGYSDKVNRESAQAIGIREFLHKPVNMRELACLVREILDRSPAAGPVP